MSLKYKLGRRVEVAPGIVNIDLSVVVNSEPPPKPKIDKEFARLFATKLKQEARQIKRDT